MECHFLNISYSITYATYSMQCCLSLGEVFIKLGNSATVSPKRYRFLLVNEQKPVSVFNSHSCSVGHLLYYFSAAHHMPFFIHNIQQIQSITQPVKVIDIADINAFLQL